MACSPDAPVEIFSADGNTRRICYSCGIGYPGFFRFCPRDGVDLEYAPPPIDDLSKDLARPGKRIGLYVLAAVLAVLLIVTLTSGHFASFSSSNGKGELGEVLLRTTPSGATVYLDGSQMGVSPIRLSDISPGVHEVRAVFPGYQNGMAHIEVPPSAKLRVAWDLVPLRMLPKDRYVAEFLLPAPKGQDAFWEASQKPI